LPGAIVSHEFRPGGVQCTIELPIAELSQAESANDTRTR